MVNNLDTIFKATVVDIKGKCSAGHKVGEVFNINCYKADGLCGYFYNSIFPSLQTFQFGGRMPWWQGDTIELKCPDHHNMITIKLEKK